MKENEYPTTITPNDQFDLKVNYDELQNLRTKTY